MRARRSGHVFLDQWNEEVRYQMVRRCRTVTRLLGGGRSNRQSTIFSAVKPGSGAEAATANATSASGESFACGRSGEALWDWTIVLWQPQLASSGPATVAVRWWARANLVRQQGDFERLPLSAVCASLQQVREIDHIVAKQYGFTVPSGHRQTMCGADAMSVAAVVSHTRTVAAGCRKRRMRTSKVIIAPPWHRGQESRMLAADRRSKKRRAQDALAAKS